MSSRCGSERGGRSHWCLQAWRTMDLGTSLRCTQGMKDKNWGWGVGRVLLDSLVPAGHVHGQRCWMSLGVGLE